MGLNYTMMKVNKEGLKKVTFAHNSDPLNIKPVELARGGVQLNDGDNLTIISQVPYMKDGNGSCIHNPRKCNTLLCKHWTKNSR